MVDIASLAIQIDTSNVTRADADLDRLAKHMREMLGFKPISARA